MKKEDISIKDYFCRIKKKGKTRGRPSNQELILSAITSQILKENKPKIAKAIEDLLINGTGILKMKYKRMTLNDNEPK